MRISWQPLVSSGREEGYVLVAVIILVAVLMISLAAAVPHLGRDIQRDREIETLHRGQQYIRAIQLYYRRFRRFPPSEDALLETNGTRFLRKRYADPITGEDDWNPIALGQNRAPLSMGDFGQPLNMGAATATVNADGQRRGIIGASPESNSLGPLSTNGSAGGSGAFRSSVDSAATDNDSGNGSHLASGTGLSGQVFTGAGIIGFSPSSAKSSVLVYKTKTHYNEWEFVYDPLSDRLLQGWPMLPTAGQPPNVGAPGFGPDARNQETSNSAAQALSN